MPPTAVKHKEAGRSFGPKVARMEMLEASSPPGALFYDEEEVSTIDKKDIECIQRLGRPLQI